MSRNYNFIIQQKIDYIHNNPVEEGIVFRPEDYKYSSALDYLGDKGILDGLVVFTVFLNCRATRRDSRGSGGYLCIKPMTISRIGISYN